MPQDTTNQFMRDMENLFGTPLGSSTTRTIYTPQHRKPNQGAYYTGVVIRVLRDFGLGAILGSVIGFFITGMFSPWIWVGLGLQIPFLVLKLLAFIGENL
jgi:MFS family permease